jgi:pyruvyltransferase
VSGSPTKRVALVDHDIHVIDVHDKWEKVVDQIVECEHIISSSLHGSVVA